MLRNILLLSIAGGVLLLSGRAAAYVGLCCGKCGGNMPMNIPGGGIPETHEFRFKLSPMYMRMDGLRDGTRSVDVDDILGMPLDMTGRPSGKYMAAPTAMDMRMFNLAAGYSFSDRFFAGTMLMYRDNDMDMQFSDMMRMQTGRDGFTMDSDGIADTMLMAKYRLFADDPLIPSRQASLFFGLSLPTGSIDERNDSHPVPMRQDELLPYGMQLGSGTWDPSIGLLYQASGSPWWWGVNGVYTARLYENKRDYRLGDEFRLDGYLMYQFSPAWLVQAQLNGHYQGEIGGEMDAYADGDSGHAVQGVATSPAATPLWETDNYGGTQLYTSLGVQWQPAPLHIVDFNVGLPLYRDLNGPQLETDYRIMLTWYIEVPTKKSIRYGIRKPVPAGGSKLGF
ncbi:MAG: transporter [Gammaproteobacteria bacterium]